MNSVEAQCPEPEADGFYRALVPVFPIAKPTKEGSGGVPPAPTGRSFNKTNVATKTFFITFASLLFKKLANELRDGRQIMLNMSFTQIKQIRDF